MNTYLTIFIVALGSSLFLTPIVRRLAQRLGWIDVPADGRRVHTAPVPRLGPANAGATSARTPASSHTRSRMHIRMRV